MRTQALNANSPRCKNYGGQSLGVSRDHTQRDARSHQFTGEELHV